MSIIAVMVNCALIGMSDLADRLFPGWGTAERIIFIVVLEVSGSVTRCDRAHLIHKRHFQDTIELCR